MDQTTHVLKVNDLCFAYPNGRKVLHDVSFSAEAGTMLCLLGPNGSGKTTLLKCLLRLLKHSSGAVLLDGQPAEQYSSGRLAQMVAYVPQTPSSAFAFTVRQIVLLGRTPHLGPMGFETDLDHRVVKAAMEMTEVHQFADRTLDELSGGEAQRVMIARALAQQPQIMLLDEPTSHLDIRNQLLIYRMMHRLAHDWNMAIVCVSHDVNLAGRFADRLVLMREGKVLAAGACDEVIRRDVLSKAYDVEVELIATSDESAPIVRAH